LLAFALFDMNVASIGARAVLITALLGCTCACGPITYAFDAGSAEKIVAQARAENADYYAPYELYFAEAQLAKAREEAAEGHYEDALQMVSAAEIYGRRALERSARPGERRP
jgi:hypothetical protein